MLGRARSRTRGWGCRAGRWWDRPAPAVMAASTGSEITCSHLPASVWASAHDRPRMSVRKRSARRWRRTTRSARRLARGGEPDRAARCRPALALDAADHLRHGRAGDLQPLGDAGLDDLDVVLVQLVDGLAVLLERGVELRGLVLGHGPSVRDRRFRPFGTGTPESGGLLPKSRRRFASHRAGTVPPVALGRFSEPVRTWFETSFPAPTRGPGPGLAGHRRGRPHPDPRPHRLGQDARRVPVGDRPADDARTPARKREHSAGHPARSTSPRCGPSPSTSRRTSGPPSRGWPWRPSGWARTCGCPRSACARATPRPTSAASWSATPPTCSSPPPSPST